MRFSRKRLAIIGAVVAALAIAVPVAFSAVTATGTLSHFDKKQHDRLFRGGLAQDCHATKANPGLFGDALIRSYDKYTFKNTAATSKCAHVFLQHACFEGPNQVGAWAQANSPFVPSDPSANYLGDPGNSTSPESFDFPVAAGQSFDVTVAEVDGGPATLPCPYALTVTIGGVQQPPPPAATRIAAGRD